MSMAHGFRLLLMLLALAAALPGAPTQEVWQSPLYTIAPEGGYIDITCCASGTLHGVYLKQRWPSPANVVYYEDGKEPTVSKRFWGRIAFSGLQHNLTITMSRLQPADTGVYACQAILKSEVWGPGTMVVVTANTCQEGRLVHLSLPAALAVGCFLTGLWLGAVCALRRTQIKRLCWVRDEPPPACVVYEDMSCSRHNMMSVSTPNHYQ